MAYLCLAEVGRQVRKERVNTQKMFYNRLSITRKPSLKKAILRIISRSSL